jgi:hypothetical protein
MYDRALSRGAAADEGADDPAPAGGGRRGTTGRSRGAAAKGAERSPAATGLEPAASVSGDAPAEDAEDEGAAATTVSAAQRRRAAATVVGLWRDLARDLLVVRLGAERDVRDPALLDDLRAASAALGEPGAADAVPGAPADPAARELTAFLQRLDLAGEQLEANLRPELVLDTLLLAWLSAPTGPE